MIAQKIGLCLVTSLTLGMAGCAGNAPPRFGKPVEGLASRLVADRTCYEHGQDIWLCLDVMNVADKPVRVAQGEGILDRLRLTRGNGEQMRMTMRIDRGNVGASTIAPGKQREVLGFYVSGNQYAMYEPLEPGRYQAVWTPEDNETVKGTRFPPESNAVTFKVVRKAATGKVVGPDAPDVPYGAPQGGLQTRIRAQRERFVAGAPIRITVELKNVGQETLCYYEPQVAINGRIEVLDSAGNPVPYIGGPAQTATSLRTLKPAQVAVLDAVDLSDYYLLSRPGKYTMRYPGQRSWSAIFGDSSGGRRRPVDAAIPPSNIFALEVLPADVNDPFRRALAVLVANCPKDWEVDFPSPAPYLAQPGAQWSRVQCRTYIFTHRELGTDRLGKQKLSLSLCIAKEKAVEETWDLDADRQARRSEYVGRSPFGYLYMEPPHETALKHWPTFRTDILNWLKVK